MKILQLTTHFSPNVGGVETHLSDLVAYLTKNDFEVIVITYRPLVTETFWKMHEKHSRLEIFRIPWLPGLFYELSHRPLLEFLYLVPGLFFATPVLLFLKRPDVIHSHGLLAGFVGVFWGRIFRKRIIISLHSIYHFPEEGIYLKFVTWIFSHADCVLCLSMQSVAEVESLGIDKDAIRQFTYWIDLETFTHIANAKNQLGWQGKFTVLFVGRLIVEKGIRELLEAASLWNKNIHLAIAGVGPLEQEIKNQKSKIKNIEFLGRIINSKLPVYYSGADIVIVPSTHEEGFGRVLLESLGCGTPIIASNRGAIPEAVDKTVALLIDITPENIIQSLEHLYTHKNKLKAMSRLARNFAKKRYSERNAEKIIDSYVSK